MVNFVFLSRAHTKIYFCGKNCFFAGGGWRMRQSHQRESELVLHKAHFEAQL
jgi:hypothetical protein